MLDQHTLTGSGYVVDVPVVVTCCGDVVFAFFAVAKVSAREFGLIVC